MILISAMGENRVIGKGDGMPWSVPDEYRQFLDFVRGNVVIMGRRSWEIFGTDLTDTHNIVVSRSANDIAGARIARSVADAQQLAGEHGGTVFSAGGAQIYRQTMPLAEAMYLSFIKGRFEGDAFFPEIDPDVWRVEQQRDHDEFRFVEYRRR